MKNIALFLSLILTLTLVLSACQPNATGSTPTSTNNGTGTTVNPNPKHDDNDNNGICDNCGGTFVNSRCMGAKCTEDGEHVWGEYKSNEYVHWREYICGHEWPDIAVGHIDAEEDGVCDACGYEMSKTTGSLDVPCYDCDGDGVCDHCKKDTLTGRHLDNNSDGICDICESKLDYKIAKWNYTDTYHWMTYDLSYGFVPDIVFMQGDHCDKNGDNICDDCGYNMTK